MTRNDDKLRLEWTAASSLHFDQIPHLILASLEIGTVLVDVCRYLRRRGQHGLSQYSDSNLGAVLGPSTVQVPNKVTIGSRDDSSNLLSIPEKKESCPHTGKECLLFPLDARITPI